MIRSRRLLVLAFLALALAGCTKDGEECAECQADSDCNAGLVCVNFLDENGHSVGKRCGSGQGTTQCRVR